MRFSVGRDEEGDLGVDLGDETGEEGPSLQECEGGILLFVVWSCENQGCISS